MKDSFGMPTSFLKTVEERFEGQLRRLPQGSGMHVSRRSNGQRAQVLDSGGRCYLPCPGLLPPAWLRQRMRTKIARERRRACRPAPIAVCNDINDAAVVATCMPWVYERLHRSSLSKQRGPTSRGRSTTLQTAVEGLEYLESALLLRRC